MTRELGPDTNCAISAKGNSWRIFLEVHLFVGQSPCGGFWATRDGDFLAGSYNTLEAAKRAAEAGS